MEDIYSMLMQMFPQAGGGPAPLAQGGGGPAPMSPPVASPLPWQSPQASGTLPSGQGLFGNPQASGGGGTLPPIPAYPSGSVNVGESERMGGAPQGSGGGSPMTPPPWKAFQGSGGGSPIGGAVGSYDNSFQNSRGTLQNPDGSQMTAAQHFADWPTDQIPQEFRNLGITGIGGSPTPVGQGGGSPNIPRGQNDGGSAPYQPMINGRKIGPDGRVEGDPVLDNRVAPKGYYFDANPKNDGLIPLPADPVAQKAVLDLQRAKGQIPGVARTGGGGGFDQTFINSPPTPPGVESVTDGPGQRRGEDVFSRYMRFLQGRGGGGMRHPMSNWGGGWGGRSQTPAPAPPAPAPPQQQQQLMDLLNRLKGKAAFGG